MSVKSQSVLSKCQPSGCLTFTFPIYFIFALHQDYNYGHMIIDVPSSS